MTETNRIEITIYDTRGVWLWLKRLITWPIMCGGPIALGLWLDSSAMQWLGFVFFLSVWASLIHKAKGAVTFYSIRAARAYLDALPPDERF